MVPVEFMAILRGLLKPVAIVVTTCEEITILRILLVSATYKMPAVLSQHIAYGELNPADVPVPSLDVDEPEPAKTVVVPVIVVK